jgi:hypothetical protein
VKFDEFRSNFGVPHTTTKSAQFQAAGHINDLGPKASGVQWRYSFNVEPFLLLSSSKCPSCLNSIVGLRAQKAFVSGCGQFVYRAKKKKRKEKNGTMELLRVCEKPRLAIFAKRGKMSICVFCGVLDGGLFMNFLRAFLLQ